MSPTPEDTFRYVLIVGSLILFPIMLFHRIRSAATGERLNRLEEGIWILVTLRLTGLAGAVGLITYMISPRRMAWASLALPGWLRWAGVWMGLWGGALLLWTLMSLGKNLTDTVVTRKEHTLVTKGPYRWIRHPFYVAFALAFLGNSLAAANWFIGACGALAFLLLVIRTAKEEENLIQRFGDSYRVYMERTGRFFPRITASR